MKEEVIFKILTESDITDISVLGQQLNSQLTVSEVQKLLKEMFTYSSYKCFGLFYNENLVGISSGWITVRLYSGKQLEIDNVIIDKTLQSKGLGTIFLNHIEAWAKNNNCKIWN